MQDRQNKLSAEEADKQMAAKAEAMLLRLEPWERYLEKNPNLKIWANANPEAAEKERAKFISRYEAEEKAKQLAKPVTVKKKYKINCAKQKTKKLYNACMSNK